MEARTNGFATLCLRIHEEQSALRGEDSALAILDGPNAGLIACMDGCGGAGAQVYASAGGVSGARLAAKHVGKALAGWFSRLGGEGTGDRDARLLAAELKTQIDRELTRLAARMDAEKSGVTSRLAKPFPTTLAACLTEVTGRNQLRCISFWAGDSRCFLLGTDGLHQTSLDDIRGSADPLEALENDSRLTNVISAGGDYTIHTMEYTVTDPCIVLTATDGCFSYFLSPIELEGVLLDCIVHAAVPVDCEAALKEKLGARASDDYSMVLAVLGFSNWEAVRTAYLPRWEVYCRTYGTPLRRILAAADRAAHQALWQQYSRNYLPVRNGGRNT